MIKRELAKDPNLASENWDRFLPKFQKKNVKRKKAPIVKKPEYTPFPPPQQPSKVDLQLESGEYFLSQSQKAARKAADQQEQQRQRVQDKQQERLKAFVPPEVRLGLLLVQECFVQLPHELHVWHLHMTSMCLAHSAHNWHMSLMLGSAGM